MISPSTVGRWLRANAIRPWRVGSWICPRDPDFLAKAGGAFDLDDRLWEGQPLGEDEYVIRQRLGEPTARSSLHVDDVGLDLAHVERPAPLRDLPKVELEQHPPRRRVPGPPWPVIVTVSHCADPDVCARGQQP